MRKNRVQKATKFVFLKAFTLYYLTFQLTRDDEK
jgi:hypothetical protein